MDLDAITRVAYERFGARQTHPNRERGHSFFHGQRVAKLALSLRRRILADDSSHDDIIYAGALFHDSQKGNEPHNESGAVFVQHALREHCSPTELAAIAQVVRLHNQRGKTDDPYIQLVQDADVLDHEGTLGLWLLFVVTAAIGESVPHALRFWELHHKHDSREPQLNYDVSRAIFWERRRYYNGVVERLRKEANGELA